MDTLTSLITSPVMEAIMNIVASVIAPIVIGWLFYLQKRSDTINDKLAEAETRSSANVTKVREDYEHRVLAIEQNHYDKLIELERKFSSQMIDMVSKFVDMHTNSASNFVTKDDFNRGFDNMSKKLDRIEDLLQKKADKP